MALSTRSNAASPSWARHGLSPSNPPRAGGCRRANGKSLSGILSAFATGVGHGRPLCPFASSSPQAPPMRWRTSKRGLLAALLIAAGIALRRTPPTIPNRPVRLVVPYPAGTSTDLLARPGSRRRRPRRSGSPFVIDNRGRCRAGIIGAEAVAKGRAPNGYTLVFAHQPDPGRINVSLYKSLPYDPVRDFSPGVARIGNQPLVLVVPAVARRRTTRGSVDRAPRPGQAGHAH